MRIRWFLLLLLVVAACGDDDETTDSATAEEAATASSEAQQAAAGPSVDLQVVVDTKIYGFRKVSDRTKVTDRIAVGTYISAKKTKSGAHLRLEVTVGPCAGCTPMAEEKTWERKAKHLLAAKKEIDKSAIFEVEKVAWKKTEGMGAYSLLFDARKRARGKTYKAEHAYAARFTDGHNLIEVKALPCDAKGHPFAKTRDALSKATTKKELKKTVRRAWAKLAKHFPTIGK